MQADLERLLIEALDCAIRMRHDKATECLMSALEAVAEEQRDPAMLDAAYLRVFRSHRRRGHPRRFQATKLKARRLR